MDKNCYEIKEMIDKWNTDFDEILKRNSPKISGESFIEFNALRKRVLFRFNHLMLLIKEARRMRN